MFYNGNAETYKWSINVNIKKIKEMLNLKGIYQFAEQKYGLI